MRFLGSGLLLSADVLADVSSLGSLTDDVLEGTPGLASGWRSALVGKLGIDAGGKLGNGTLDEGALSVAGTEEDGVDNDQDPRSLLEEKGRAEHAEPKGNLEDSNKGHAAVVVLLYELANSIGQGGLGLGTRLSSSRRRLDGGQQVRAHIGCDVEYRVDCKRQDSQRNLARKEPDKSHD